MGVFLGVLSALTYGATDFLGGLMSRRTSVLAVVFGSNLVGTVIVAPFLLVVAGVLSPAAVWWALAAGVCGGLGVASLFRGLAMGRMSAVAPVTAVVTAAVPIVTGIVLGERPGPGALAGVVVALAGVVLIASGEGRGEHAVPPPAGLDFPGVPEDERHHEPRPREPRPGGTAVRVRTLLPPGLLEAALAGLFFGTYLALLDASPDDSGLWPVIVSRLMSLVTVATLAALAGRSLLPSRGSRLGIVGAGILDAVGNVMFIAAVRLGLLSLVGAVSALYPVGTVLLARAILHERLIRMQLAGLAMCGVGIGLIALT
ncbi:MAG: DMT family transporter [Actinobacteria bacterium]|nr:DMT family transporter [Actinomycetota bacterium]